MILAFYNFPHDPLQVYHGFNKLSSVLLEICSGQKCDGRADGQITKVL